MGGKVAAGGVHVDCFMSSRNINWQKNLMKLSSWEFLEEVSGYHNRCQYLSFIDNRYGKFMFCGPGCPHRTTGPMILIHIRSHLKPLSGQVYKCVWAPWAKINSFQVGWDVVFHAVALASCVLVEDGKSNATSRDDELKVNVKQWHRGNSCVHNLALLYVAVEVI